MSRASHIVLLGVSMAAMTASAGCAVFDPNPSADVPFKERARTQRKGNLRVTAGVPSAREAKALFDASLYKEGIQPIWLEIDNGDEEPVWVLPVGIDPDYFSPLGAAALNHFGPRNPQNKEMDRYYRERGMAIYVPPRSVRSGYVFTNLDEGTKSFNVDVIGQDEDMRTFTFFIEVPGLRADHREVDFESLYTEDQVLDLDEQGLIEALESLPCCVTDKKGKDRGDPLNLVVIGESEEVFQAFLRAGWDETETIYGGSLLKTGRSFLFGGQYRYSPVSALYVYGRGQDIALQRARDTIHERNHLRLWLSPLRFEGTPVWVGQISRDIGVRFTMKTITTHKIDPDIDETREYLLENLWYSGTLLKFAYVEGVGAAPIGEPRGNLTGDPYFTDGFRLVVWLAGEPVVLTDVEVIDWRMPPER